MEDALLLKSITPIGKTDWRNQKIPFGIKDRDRLNHIYVIGKTGLGKSTLLLNMAIADINRGNGLAVIDPHGDLATKLLDYIPMSRIGDVIYFNPADTEFSVPFNPLADIERSVHHLAVAGLVSTFKRIWADSWGPRLEHVLRFSLFTLLEYGKATLLDLPPLLTDEGFRKHVLKELKSEAIAGFWKREIDRLSPFMKAEVMSPILNKFGLFQVNEALRFSIGQRGQTWSAKSVMDNKGIFIANLSKGQIGEDASSLLGSMLVNAFQLAALSRASERQEDRTPLYMYIDEAHSFLSSTLADIMAECRKYGLSLFLTNQYLDQLHEKVCSAIFGNVGTLIVFRVGADDAFQLAREFHPVFSANDLLTLPPYTVYLKLMIDGMASKAFSAVTLPAQSATTDSQNRVIALSREKFARTKTHVEKAVQIKETFSSGKTLFDD